MRVEVACFKCPKMKVLLHKLNWCRSFFWQTTVSLDSGGLSKRWSPAMRIMLRSSHSRQIGMARKSSFPYWVDILLQRITSLLILFALFWSFFLFLQLSLFFTENDRAIIWRHTCADVQHMAQCTCSEGQHQSVIMKLKAIWAYSLFKY